MKIDENIINVGIAEMNVVSPPNLIRTSGLGSCVAVILYDVQESIAGLAHIMLPDSSLAKRDSVHLAKYADTAISGLIKMLEKNSKKPLSLKAKIAGGAQMFKFISQNDMMKIGERNVQSVKKELARLSIPITGEDVGGSNGRTVIFDPKTGVLSIRTINKGTHEI